MTDDELTNFVEAHIAQCASGWSDGERACLRALMMAFAQHGMLPSAEVSSALDDLLECPRFQSLKDPPARSYVDHFFSMHPDAARRIFFKSARKELEPEQRSLIDQVFGFELLIELWPVGTQLNEVEGASAAAPIAPAKAVFREDDYRLITSKLFHRDRVFGPKREDFEAAILNAQDVLKSALDEAEIQQDRRAEFECRLETEFLSRLREAIEAIDRGEPAGLIHFMI